ncbi:MAG TPA: globin domain-containing protein, partial [Marmoricola sp.]|nr:globin domain-containing protein [Marmoricola sp.]
MDAVLLETSLALVDTPDDGLTTRFYAILFERYPAVRPMFGPDTARQAKMLRSAIVSVVDHLDDPVWLTETLGELGARHAGWGVLAEMYDAV